MKQNRTWIKEIVDGFVAQLEQGVAPWINPVSGISGMPQNYKTRRAYKGVNVLQLWMRAEQEGFTSPYWITFAQCKIMSGSLMKGSKGTRVVWWDMQEVKPDNPDDEPYMKWIAKSYTVFNLEQTNLEPPPSAMTQEEKEHMRYPMANDFIERTGANILTKSGLRPAYHPKKDLIYMPTTLDFTHQEEYVSTLMHELSHWTGHENRLNRITLNKFDKHGYGMEELIAELASAFLCSYLNIPKHKVSHDRYLAGWAKAIGEKPSILFKASNQAQAAYDYLRKITRVELPEEDQEAVNQ